MSPHMPVSGVSPPLRKRRSVQACVKVKYGFSENAPSVARYNFDAVNFSSGNYEGLLRLRLVISRVILLRMFAIVHRSIY